MTELTAAEKELSLAIEDMAMAVAMMKMHTTPATVQALRSRAETMGHKAHLVLLEMKADEMGVKA